jgi:hypothetical protein
VIRKSSIRSMSRFAASCGAAISERIGCASDLRHIVHGVLPRSHSGYRIVETWDTLGHARNAERRRGAGRRVRARQVHRSHRPGQPDGPIRAGHFRWALTGFADIYYGMARRAIDLAVTGIKKKTSLAVSRSMAYIRYSIIARVASPASHTLR